jgi:anti-sigma factor RsiW
VPETLSCDACRERLGELIDGTLASDARRVLDAHLAECVACRAIADDLRRIRDVAGTLERLSPPDRVWPAIASRLQHDAQRRSLFRNMRVWLPMAAALIVVSGLTWFVARNLRQPQTGSGVVTTARPDTTQRPAGAQATGNASDADVVQSVEESLRLAEQHYEKAIRGLEQIAQAENSALDPQVAATMRKNLSVIDQAISESRAAVRSQPDSRTAQDSLFEALRRKVVLLQDTIALMNEMRKGNEAGVARIAEGLDKS